MDNQHLEREKIPKLLLSMVLPATCAQLITLIYSTVDRMYIGRMPDGTTAMAAIGICTPITSLIAAFAALFGKGGAPLAAIEMGKKEHRSAEKYLNCSFIMLLTVSALILFGTVFARRPLLLLFGASGTTLDSAEEYLAVYVWGTFFVLLTVGMNYYITTQGFAATAMITTLAGALINIVLDPIFIFAMDMGIAGAALATVISQACSCIWVLAFLLGKKTLLHLRLEDFIPGRDVLKSILALGAAPFFMSGSESVLHACFNRQAYAFGGDMAVSAMTILFTVFQFLLLLVEGFTIGAQPIISYNYGAKRYDRVKQTIRIVALSTLAITLVLTTAVMLWPEKIFQLFNPDLELVRLGSSMLRVYVLGIFIMGLNSTWQQTYNALGDGKRSMFFAFLRKGILLIPALYLFPALLPGGVLAVVAAEPFSDIVTTLTNTIYIRRYLSQRLRKL